MKIISVWMLADLLTRACSQYWQLQQSNLSGTGCKPAPALRMMLPAGMCRDAMHRVSTAAHSRAIRFVMASFRPVVAAFRRITVAFCSIIARNEAIQVQAMTRQPSLPYAPGLLRFARNDDSTTVIARNEAIQAQAMTRQPSLPYAPGLLRFARNDGVGRCNDGVGRCNDGVGDCNDGVGRYDDGVRRCNDGVRDCNDGVGCCDDGVGRCNDEVKDCNDRVGDCAVFCRSFDLSRLALGYPLLIFNF
jgi:hypothetical protein